MITKIFNIVNSMPFSLSSKLYFFLRLMVSPLNEIEKIIPKKGKIIDLGCGSGPLSMFLALSSPNRHILGWDMDGERLRNGMVFSKTIKNLIF